MAAAKAAGELVQLPKPTTIADGEGGRELACRGSFAAVVVVHSVNLLLLDGWPPFVYVCMCCRLGGTVGKPDVADCQRAGRWRCGG